MQIYYFLYLCPEQTIILAMEIENQSVDYRPLILVAEDDDSNFKLIKAIIGKKCEVQWARNGEEIVSLFLENRDKADAILMDIKMPVMNGLDATQRIRREGGTLPIIMQTAYAFSCRRFGGAGETDNTEHLAQLPEQLSAPTGVVGLHRLCIISRHV